MTAGFGSSENVASRFSCIQSHTDSYDLLAEAVLQLLDTAGLTTEAACEGRCTCAVTLSPLTVGMANRFIGSALLAMYRNSMLRPQVKTAGTTAAWTSRVTSAALGGIAALGCCCFSRLRYAPARSQTAATPFLCQPTRPWARLLCEGAALPRSDGVMGGIALRRCQGADQESQH